MSNKRVKRVHISGWLDVFLADTIMARIAHYLSTPTLFQLLLGVNKELRKKATTSKRWNQIMEYGRRMVEDLRIIYPYMDNQNLLAKFVKRLYAKTACSFCFQMIGGREMLKTRPNSVNLRICWRCGKERDMIMTDDDFARVFSRPDAYLELPRIRMWKHELGDFVPIFYKRCELKDVLPWARRKKDSPRTFHVVGANGKTHLVRLRKEHEIVEENDMPPFLFLLPK